MQVFNASVNGICQETCRDLGHTQYGMASTLNAAETARIQGVDLYGAQVSSDRVGGVGESESC